MSVLYRRYRPQKFSEVVGQEYIKKIISEEVKKGGVAHAFLFVGPRGVGKTTLARILAKAVNCLKRKEGESEPCGQCRHCQALDYNRLLDVIEIDAASHTGVQNVRDNIISISQVPPSAFYKVFIIDEVHMLSASAFNALLKTLEEPPEKVIFILATTEIQKVPATIISRCQRFDFKKISFLDIEKRLSSLAKKEGINVENGVFQEIAYYSDGCLRDAESLLGQIFSLGEKEITLDDLRLILPANSVNLALDLTELMKKGMAKEAIELVNSSFTKGNDLKTVFRELLEVWRNILLFKISPELKKIGKSFDEEKSKKIEEIVQSFSEKTILDVLDILKKRFKETKEAKIEQMPLELAVVEVCQMLSRFVDPLPEKNKEKPKHNPSLVASRGDIAFVWPKVVEQSKKFNNSLSSLLATGRIISLDDDTLKVSFPYSFHVKKAEEEKNRKIVEELLKNNLGVDIKFLPVLNKEESLENKGENFSLDTFSEVFGDDIEMD